MMDSTLTVPDERILPKTPFLSHSQVSRYLHCPEQYRLYYIEKLRPRFPSASLVFGQIIHQALAYFFRTKNDPVQFFLENWADARQVDLTYSIRDSWEKLEAVGQALLEKFVKEEVQNIGEIEAVEKVFELNITGFQLPFVGVIDLVTEQDGKKTIVDFKTSGSSYADHEVAMSDQLTAYQLALPEAEEMALCTLVKTKEPRIEWHVSTRSPEQLLEYLSKVGYVAREIVSGRFYKRPGKWCAWCDFLPVCLKDEKKIKETLVQIEY